MGWRDRYQQASFRGVPFFIERAESEFGRRTQLHEFPNRDTPYSEDLGKRGRVFAVDGYIIGDDFYEQKETLIRAVELHGLGKLVHPYYGVLYVACRRCRVSDSSRELRMARISFEFEESGEPTEPTILTNTKVAADTAKKNALSKATDAFVAVYSTVRKPIAETSKLLSTVDTGISLIGTVRQSVGSIADFQRKILSLDESVTTLITDSLALARGILDVLTFGTFPFSDENPLESDNAQQQFDELREFFDFSPEVPDNDDSPVNRTNELFQVAAVIAAGGMIPEMPFDSYEAARASANVVFEKLDRLEEAGVLGSDKDLLAAIRSLRATIMEDIENRSDSLARLSTVTLPEFLPAIVLSYRLYGNRDEESDIVERNSIDHPGFVEGVRPIEVRINV